MSYPEYPVEKAGLEGTGLTEAVCPKGHGKTRIVSADALQVKGAPLNTFALKCLEPLKKGDKPTGGRQAGSPVRTGEVSANMTVHASGAPLDADLCQEVLVPVESYDEGGRLVRKNGKALDKPIAPKRGRRGEDQGPEQFESEGATSGGEKVAAASGTDVGKKTAKKSARKSTRKKAA